MTEPQENHRYIPEHPVAMRLDRIANTRSERIEFGKVTPVRVQTIGIIESFEINESDVEFVIVDENKQNRMVVQKILTSAFPRDRAEEFLVNDYVEIFGKVRVLENGTSFLNALSIDVVSRHKFEAFKEICEFAKGYYEENFAQLPSSVHSKCADRLGLRKKAGALDRFPIDLLESSSSQQNNMGVWPTEIEELAGGISQETSSDESCSDEEDDEDSSENEEEEEDSFDAGPGGLGGFEAQESAEDSFDAGPTTILKIEEKKTEEMEQTASVPLDYDSFEDL